MTEQTIQYDLHLIERRRINRLITPFQNFIRSLIDQAGDRAQGVDLSHYDGDFNPDLAAQPIHFAIFKLTEGTTWIDPLVDLIGAGVAMVRVRAGYHYLRSGMSWTAQVNNYLNAASKFDLHFHALDLEGIGNTYSDTFFADARRWIDDVRVRTGKKVILYTNLYTYNLFEASIKRQYADAQVWLDELELWIAYPSATLSVPPLPAGRATAKRPWTFWQLSWTGTPADWGTLAYCDVNLFYDTPQALDVWAGVSDPIPSASPSPSPSPSAAPPSGLYVLTVKASALNGRSSPEVNSTNVIFPSGFKLGDTVIAGDPVPDSNGKTLWYPISLCVRAGAAVSLPVIPTWASDGHTAGYLSWIKTYDCEVPVPQPETISFTVQRPGYQPLTLTGTQEPE